MAGIDLIGINENPPVSIVGLSTIGVTQTPVGSSVNGELAVSDTNNHGGVHGQINVTTVPVELKVGISRFPTRKLVQFQAKDNGIVFGYNNTITYGPGPNAGIEHFKDQLIMFPVGENTSVWFVSNSISGILVRIAELA